MRVNPYRIAQFSILSGVALVAMSSVAIEMGDPWWMSIPVVAGFAAIIFFIHLGVALWEWLDTKAGEGHSGSNT